MPVPSSGRRIVHGKMLLQLQSWHLFRVYPAPVSCENLIPWSVLKYVCGVWLYNQLRSCCVETRLTPVRCTDLFPINLAEFVKSLKLSEDSERGVVRGRENQSSHEKCRKFKLCLRWRFLNFLPTLESSVFKSNQVWWNYRLAVLFSSDWRRTGGKYVRKL